MPSERRISVLLSAIPAILVVVTVSFDASSRGAKRPKTAVVSSQIERLAPVGGGGGRNLRHQRTIVPGHETYAASSGHPHIEAAPTPGAAGLPCVFSATAAAIASASFLCEPVDTSSSCSSSAPPSGSGLSRSETVTGGWQGPGAKFSFDGLSLTSKAARHCRATPAEVHKARFKPFSECEQDTSCLVAPRAPPGPLPSAHALHQAPHEESRR